jgi:hypothetical protein
MRRKWAKCYGRRQKTDKIKIFPGAVKTLPSLAGRSIASI